RLLPPWSAAGENVGTGGSVGSIFDALVGSSGHRANMLGDYTHMGVGVFVDGAGRLWAVHLFTR
ncbi:MAG: CAP domain-containing protein, partial [Acidimicrobiia bacterium]